MADISLCSMIDILSSVAILKEVREIMKERYQMGLISENQYREFLEGELETIQKCAGGEANV